MECKITIETPTGTYVTYQDIEIHGDQATIGSGWDEFTFKVEKQDP